MFQMLDDILKGNPHVKKLERSINKLRGRSQGGPIALHSYRAIYFPVPKVACSSLISSCADLLNIKEGPKTDIHKLYFPSINIEEIEKYKDYYKFGFVRNPWDRLLSCYTNKITDNVELTNARYLKGIARSFSQYGVFVAGMSFEDFIKTILDWPDETSNPHFKSQYTFLSGKDGKLIVDFIGRFESLADDFEHIRNHLNIPMEKLPHRQKSQHKNFRDYYTEKLVDLVGQRYSKDIELFEYDFK